MLKMFPRDRSPDNAGEDTTSVPSTPTRELHLCPTCYAVYYTFADPHALCIFDRQPLILYTQRPNAHFTWYPFYRYCIDCGKVIMGRVTDRTHHAFCKSKFRSPLPQLEAFTCTEDH